MNLDDRCQHVPTSPGQSVCTCLDGQMWRDFVIEVQAEVIANLNLQLHGPVEVRYYRLADGTTVSKPVEHRPSPPEGLRC